MTGQHSQFLRCFYYFSSQRHRNGEFLSNLYSASLLILTGSPKLECQSFIVRTSLRYSGQTWFLHLSDSSRFSFSQSKCYFALSCNSLFPGTSPSPCQWTHLLYSIHPHSTFYIHVLLSSAPLAIFFLMALFFRAGDTNPNPAHNGMGRFYMKLIFI